MYDISTIAILWFAGASATAGLLNLVPRYLPRYGMAPEWTRAVRPLVLIFVAIAFFITWWFDADVDAQSGAYATGVLVLMLSASFASTVAVHRRGRRGAALGFGVITAVFAYTLVTNVIERPDGIKIALLFIVGIVVSSFASRVHRAFELRATAVTFDECAARFVDEAAQQRRRCGSSRTSRRSTRRGSTAPRSTASARRPTSRTAGPCCSWRSSSRTPPTSPPS